VLIIGFIIRNTLITLGVEHKPLEEPGSNSGQCKY